MEIDVFYQNDDMAFGFTGDEKPMNDDYAFAKNAIDGFADVDYSYANGEPFKPSGFNDVSDSVNATGREGEVEKWWPLTDADKKDLVYIDGIKQTGIQVIRQTVVHNKVKRDSIMGGRIHERFIGRESIQRHHFTLG
jgi:hypothetical protein